MYCPVYLYYFNHFEFTEHILMNCYVNYYFCLLFLETFHLFIIPQINECIAIMFGFFFSWVIPIIGWYCPLFQLTVLYRDQSALINLCVSSMCWYLDLKLFWPVWRVLSHVCLLLLLVLVIVVVVVCLFYVFQCLYL